MVEEIMGPETAAIIQKIPLSQTGAIDRLIWLGTKDGFYSVRSGYHFLKEKQNMLQGQTSTNVKLQERWTCCWHLKIPQAAKVFMWRACLESLPTRVNLYKRKIVDSPLCLICLTKEESIEHVLWSCKSAMDVWSQERTELHKSSLRAEKFKDIFESLCAICNKQVLEFFVITARSIWHRRNKLIFEDSFQHPTQIVSQSKILLQEFKAVHDSPTTIITVSQVMNWNPPPPGFLKINWDAAISEIKGRIGLGIVVRDHGVNIVATKQINHSGFNDPLLAEALGASQAVKMAADLGMDYVFFEGDSSQVIKGLNSHVERWDSVGMMLSDTRLQLNTFSSWKFLFVKRSANHLAHSLAKSSLRFDEDTVVLDLSPSFSHVISEV